jgi:hypothetical protein
MIDANNFNDAANMVIDKKISETTKKNYRGKLNVIKIFFLSDPKYSSCLVNEDIVVPIEESFLKELFGWLSTNTDIPKKNRRQRNIHRTDNLSEGESESEGENEAPTSSPQSGNDVMDVDTFDTTDVFATSEVTMSYPCMQGYKSAISWLYSVHECSLSASINSWLDDFVRGYKKVVADKKSRGVMNITEGKAALTFSSYCKICLAFAKLVPVSRKFTWNESIFAWSYMTLCWTMISRSHSVGISLLTYAKIIFDKVYCM